MPLIYYQSNRHLDHGLPGAFFIFDEIEMHYGEYFMIFTNFDIHLNKNNDVNRHVLHYFYIMHNAPLLRICAPYALES